MANNEVILNILAETRDAVRSINHFQTEANKSLSSTNSIIEKASASFSGLSKSVLAIGASYLTFNAVKNAIKDLSDFNQAVIEIQTITDEATVYTKDFQTALLDLSSKYATQATEQAKSYYQIVSAGVTDSTIALETLNAANKLAIGGLSSTTQSVDILTTALNVFGADTLSAAQASDILFASVKVGKTTVSELSSSLGPVLSLAKELGVSFEDTAGAVAELTGQGRSTSIAVTQLKAVFIEILRIQKDLAKQSPEVQNAFNLTALKTKGLTEFLKGTYNAVGNTTKGLSKLVGSQEAILGFAGLSAQGFTKLTESLKATNNSAGASEVAFGQMTNSIGFQINKLGTLKDNLLLKITTEGEGPVLDALKGLNIILEGITNNWGTVQKVFNHIPIVSEVISISRSLGELSVVIENIIGHFETLPFTFPSIRQASDLLWIGIQKQALKAVDGIYKGIGKLISFVGGKGTSFDLGFDYASNKLIELEAEIEKIYVRSENEKVEIIDLKSLEKAKNEISKINVDVKSTAVTSRQASEEFIKDFRRLEESLKSAGLTESENIKRLHFERMAAIKEALDTNLIKQAEYNKYRLSLELEFNSKIMEALDKEYEAKNKAESAISKIKEDARKADLDEAIANAQKEADELNRIFSTTNLVKSLASGGLKEVGKQIATGIGIAFGGAAGGEAVSIAFDILSKNQAEFKQWINSLFDAQFIENILVNLGYLIQQVLSPMFWARIAKGIGKALVDGIGNFLTLSFSDFDDSELQAKIDETNDQILTKQKELQGLMNQANKEAFEEAMKDDKARLDGAIQARADAEKEYEGLIKLQKELQYKAQVDLLQNRVDEEKIILENATAEKERLEKEYTDTQKEYLQKQRDAVIASLSEAVEAQKTVLTKASSEVDRLTNKLEDLRRKQEQKQSDDKLKTLEDSLREQKAVLDYAQSDFINLQKDADEIKAKLFYASNDQEIKDYQDQLDTIDALLVEKNANLIKGQEYYNSERDRLSKELGIQQEEDLLVQITNAETELKKAQEAELVAIDLHDKAVLTLENKRKEDEVIITQETLDLIKGKLDTAREVELLARDTYNLSVAELSNKQKENEIQVTDDVIKNGWNKILQAIADETAARDSLNEEAKRLREEMGLEDDSTLNKIKKIQEELDALTAKNYEIRVEIKGDNKFGGKEDKGLFETISDKGLRGLQDLAGGIEDTFSNLNLPKLPKFPGMATGGYIDQDMPAYLHKNELVVPARTTDSLFNLIDNLSKGSSPNGNMSQQGQPIQVNLNVSEKQLASVLLNIKRQGFRTA